MTIYRLVSNVTNKDVNKYHIMAIGLVYLIIGWMIVMYLTNKYRANSYVIYTHIHSYIKVHIYTCIYRQ